MDRREFLRAGLISAALSAGKSLPLEASGRLLKISRGGVKGSLDLTNDELIWRLAWDENGLKSMGFVNKLTGRSFPFSSTEEIALTFSASRRRIEIPWWRFVFGPDDHPVAPEQEQGLKRGFHLKNELDASWGATENLLLRKLRGAGEVHKEIQYNGYGWFRHWFVLPEEGRGEEIFFVLGGYDCQDWNEYWIYLNGEEVGHKTSEGRWRHPGQFVLVPGAPGYATLNFGSGAKNLLAVRTRGFEKRFGGYSDAILRKYVYKPVLVDQFISVGQPFARLTEFQVKEVSQQTGDQVEFELFSQFLPVVVSARYALNGPFRRKSFEIKNHGDKDLLLLDVGLDDFTLDSPTSEGGSGEPLFIDGEAFCAVEHPAGLNQGGKGSVKLTHYPGIHLPSGGHALSHAALLGVSKTGEALNQFTSYLQANSPRKRKFLSVYDPFGMNNQWGWCPTLNDLEMLDGLNVLERWQRQGIHFDYYVPDWGWLDNSSDLTRFRPECFPEGPRKVIERVNALGINFGLWFSVSNAAVSCGEYPPVEPSRVPVPGGPAQPTPPVQAYRNGYLASENLDGNLCVASEPYFTILKNAILYHIRENNLKLVKLDMGSYYCNSTEHNHLPGKFSVEKMLDRLIELTRAAREAEPEVCVVWYWGVRSPFFALYGDFIFESGLFMEGSGTSWIPTLHYRDSVTLNLDMSTQFAKTIPPINKDSLGVWLADNRWGNFMAQERWREALVMDLGRGSLFFPQLWGDLYLLDHEDLVFLGEMQALSRKNESLFLQRRHDWGDPWKNEIYGYANFQGTHGFVFLSNVHFMARKAELPLGPALGMEADSGKSVELMSHFPEKKRIVRQDGTTYRTGESVELWLRPFETLMIEVLPHEDRDNTLRLPSRGVYFQQASRMGSPLVLQRLAQQDDWMGMEFADAKRFEAEGKTKKVFPFTTTLGSLEGKHAVLAISIRLREGMEDWRYAPSVTEIVQIVARLGSQTLHLIPVPDARQFGNTQNVGGSWVVYKSRLSLQAVASEFRFAVHCYLPEHVAPQIEGWFLSQWWEERSRPIAEGFYADSPS